MLVVILVAVVVDVIIVTVIVVVIVQGGGCGFLGRRDFLIFSASATHWNVTKGATLSPVTTTCFAKVTRLSK